MVVRTQQHHRSKPGRALGPSTLRARQRSAHRTPGLPQFERKASWYLMGVPISRPATTARGRSRTSRLGLKREPNRLRRPVGALTRWVSSSYESRGLSVRLRVVGPALELLTVNRLIPGSFPQGKCPENILERK